MKSMKKLTALFLSLVMILALTACGDKAGDDKSGGGTSGSNPYDLDYTSEELQPMTDERASEEKLIEAKDYYLDGLQSKPDEFSKMTYKDIAEYIGVDASEYQHFESWQQDRYTWYVEGNEGPCLLAAFDGSGNLYAITASVG